MKKSVKNLLVAIFLALPLTASAGWIESFKFKGDLRLRYQTQSYDVAGKEDRSRFRLRYRLAAEAMVKENLKVSAGLASGSDDPRSTNQTFQDSFSSKGINLNHAYMTWEASEMINVLAGKIEKAPFWLASDLLWDGDITPEGFAVAMDFAEMSPNLSLFVNLGAFVLDEYKGTEDDPRLYVGQVGFNAKMAANLYLKLAASYFSPTETEGNSFDFSEGGNTRVMVGENEVLTYEYKAPVASVEFGQTDISDVMPFWAIFGDYVTNSDPSDNDTGYLAGIKFGHKKVKKAAQWQVKVMKRYLEADAWLDIFPDSDMYSGKTGVEALEAIFELGVAENTILGIDYYKNEFIEGAAKTEDVVQLDLILKF